VAASGELYLGIEIGGTKLQLGVGPGDGTPPLACRMAVDVAAGPEGIRQQIVSAVTMVLAASKIDRPQLRGAGIGFGGPVDDATQTVIKSHQIPGWDNFALAAWIEEVIGAPAVLGNDADVAGLAEALFGAGKGLSPVFYITVGSGIGGGLIIDGEIYRGCGRGAAEIGHLRVPLLVQGTLTRGPLEEVASGWAIARRARAALTLPENQASLLPRSREARPLISAKDVAEAAEKGDKLALMILNDAWSELAEGICHVLSLLCPRRIIIGGGVSLMGERLLFEPLRRLVAERVFQPFAGCYDIVPAALGEEVVVHGALALARRRLGGEKP
jgi:glucokinase